MHGSNTHDSISLTWRGPPSQHTPITPPDSARSKKSSQRRPRKVWKVPLKRVEYKGYKPGEDRVFDTVLELLLLRHSLNGTCIWIREGEKNSECGCEEPATSWRNLARVAYLCKRHRTYEKSKSVTKYSEFLNEEQASIPEFIKVLH